MKRKKKKSSSKKQKNFVSNIVLSTDDVIITYNHLARLRVPEHQRAWIESRMYELRERATEAEVSMIGILKSLKIPFIPQAPFVLDGNIFFADFYLPSMNTVIEIDGGYHDSNYMKSKDGNRDYLFNSYRIRTIRIRNEIAKNKTKAKEMLAAANIIKQ